MKMRVLCRAFLVSRTESPDPVIRSDAVGEPRLHQPFEVAVETDPVDRAGRGRLQTLPHFQMAQGLFRFQQGFENRYPQAGDPLSQSADALRCFSVWNRRCERP